MRSFHNIHRSSGLHDGNSKAQDKAASFELPNAGRPVCRGIDDGSDNDDGGADEHSTLATILINSRTNKRKSNHTAYLVDGGDDAGPETILGAVKKGLEIIVDEQAVEQRPVITVDCRTEEAHETAEVKNQAWSVKSLRRLLLLGQVESLGAVDGYD